jgi:hypothetical protein
MVRGFVCCNGLLARTRYIEKRLDVARHLSSVRRDVGCHARQFVLQPLSRPANSNAIQANCSTSKLDRATIPRIAPKSPAIRLSLQLNIRELQPITRRPTRHRSLLGWLVFFLPPKIANSNEFDVIQARSARCPI